ncbi:MAG: GNAT family N-acetyltransferase [Myxococcota bacterium]
MLVRPARPDEIPWVNEHYREVDFVESRPERELIAIAEVEGERAGLGRLVSVDDENTELGGMLVLPAFRGRGIAAALVRFLLEHARGRTVWCIPFAHLSAFYREASGFVPVADAAAPPAVREKFRWCQAHYAQPTELLVRTESG